MKINCIAVDDEPLALSHVGKFIGQTPFLTLVGSFASAVEALKSIHTKKIDLIYLDIQMPDLNGIELARVISSGHEAPRIIFTTAFAQYSLEGYKVDALDYLLKPFNYEEFFRTASKAKKYFELIEEKALINGGSRTEQEFLFLKVEYQLVKIQLDDILFIEGLKDYVKVHLKSQEAAVLSLTSLKALEEKLPEKRFMRIHRSYIVALDKITAMTKNAIQIGKTSITVGDQYKKTYTQFFEKWS